MHSVLAARTDFSLGESILTTEDLVEEAERIGQKTIAFSDTMSLSALIDLSEKAKEHEIGVIPGVRLRMTDDPGWRPGPGEKKKHMPRAHFISAYALTEAGLKALFRLLTLANSEARFYYVPKLGWSDLYAELDAIDVGDLAFVIGDELSALEHPDAEGIAKRISQGSEHVYAGMVAIDTPYFGRCNQIAAGLCALPGVEPLVIRPALYCKGQADAQEIMTGICEGSKITDGWFRSRYKRDLHLQSFGEMMPEVKACILHLRQRGVADAKEIFTAGMQNTDAFVDAARYRWEKMPVSLPRMAPDEFQAVVDECRKGWKERFAAEVFGHKPGQKELNEVYMPRLKYELGILKELEFSGYFLLVQEIVQFAKKSDILVGPGRGSVGGSLVAYLMGITECDPIRFELMFERFINPERIDLPDADLDFMSERRHEVVEYLVSKYGRSKVGGVSNYGRLAAASAIRDVGRIIGIPEKDFSVSKMVPKKHGANVPLPECREAVAEIDQFAQAYSEIWPVMELLEGKVRNMSQHAAGLVIAGVDLCDRAVIEKRKDNEVVCWDKRTVENMGLVKIDILGLSNLDHIALALEYISERHGHKPAIGRIPLDDPDVIDRFARGKTTGIFQFESGGMRGLLKELGADGTLSFEEIAAASALYRPGPMESGMMESFSRRKQGYEPIEYDHPLMEPILKPTYGVIVYQEQVMKISQAIAGYTGPEADNLRKIMGKKLPEKMAKERDKFVRGCVETIQCVEEWAGALFDKIEGFAGYGFNRSHSVEYSLISYQSMWLKVHYPVEFYAAALTIMPEEKLPGLIKEAAQDGITVAMPDINKSTDRFEIVTDKSLAIPFQRVKGISEKTAAAIMQARSSGPFSDKADFLARVEKRRCNIRHQDILDRIGAFARIEPGQLPADHPDRVRDQIELIPGLVTANVMIGRDMHRDKLTRGELSKVVDEYRDQAGDASMPVKPHFGRKPRFMIVSDAPNNEDDRNGVMGYGMSNSAVTEALAEAGLDMTAVYWTALCKVPKADRQVTPEQIALYRKYLEREIDLLKPPIIVMLGSVTTRFFLPGFKGKASDAAGKVEYNADFDANLIVAFSPGEIYHAPEKQENMNAVFAKVAELLD
jgi:DNA polymerase-3 subunit alpha